MKSAALAPVTRMSLTTRSASPSLSMRRRRRARPTLIPMFPRSMVDTPSASEPATPRTRRAISGATPASTAPISTCGPVDVGIDGSKNRGKPAPRASVMSPALMAAVLSPALMAGLSDCGRWVGTEPPLSASGLRAASPTRMLLPPSVMPALLVPELGDAIVLARVAAAPESTSIPPAAPPAPLLTMVQLTNVPTALPWTAMAPPEPEVTLPEIVEFVTVAAF